MPWTFAHPAAVLPLRPLKRLSFGALVVGSIAPDIGYYLGRFDLAAAALFVVRYVVSCTTVFAVALSAASLWVVARQESAEHF